MAFSYLTNISLDQAKKDYILALREQGFAARTETIRVQDSFGRLTARAVYANINAPHYAASAMDGIALHARDSFGATETTPITLKEGQFTVVDTGDPIPEGCDAVIMVEELVRNDDGSVEDVDLGAGGVALAERLSVQLMSEARDMLLEVIEAVLT